MKRTSIVLVLVLLAATLTGCALFRRPGADVSRTPNQVLWQLRAQIVQLANDVEGLGSNGLISPSRYDRLKLQVERAAKGYNEVRHAYEVSQKLDASSVDAVRASLRILIQELATVKEGDS